MPQRVNTTATVTSVTLTPLARVVRTIVQIVLAVGVAIPFSPLGKYLGFTRLPPLYWPLLAVSLLCYAALTQTVKMWLLRKQWI